MKKMQILGMLLFAVLFSFSIQSCDDDDDDGPDEFIADNSTFANFESWDLQATETGVSSDLATSDTTQAHGGGNPDITRRIYFKDGQDRVDGSYPVGTLIGKSMKLSDGSGVAYFGMAKRGNGFSSLGDWEWFILNADGSIASDADGNPERGGADYKACGGCHAGAIAMDYTFTK